MKKYIAFVLALVYVLSLVGCAGKSDGTTSSEHKSFEFENVSKLIVISVDGKRFEVNDTDTVRQITENIESIRFEKGESSENTNGFGPFIQWYDTNDNLIESVSVMGEQTIIHNGFFWTATDGSIDAELLERVFTEISEETEISDDENGLSGTALYGVSAEVIEVLENGRCEVKVIGEDQNFAIGDIIIINYDHTNGEVEESSLKTGDIIAITYSIFEKTDAVYEITPGQIDLMDLVFFGIY